MFNITHIFAFAHKNMFVLLNKLKSIYSILIKVSHYILLMVLDFKGSKNINFLLSYLLNKT